MTLSLHIVQLPKSYPSIDLNLDLELTLTCLRIVQLLKDDPSIDLDLHRTLTCLRCVQLLKGYPSGLWSTRFKVL